MSAYRETDRPRDPDWYREGDPVVRLALDNAHVRACVTVARIHGWTREQMLELVALELVKLADAYRREYERLADTTVSPVLVVKP